MHPSAKMKNVIFFDPYPQGLDDFDQKSQKPYLFMKYFPKYLKNLTIDSKNGAVKSKVKRAKVIHDLKSTEYFTKDSHWRLLLTNKMKSVKKLSNSYQSTIQFVQKIKLFSGLQSIRLVPLDGPDEFEQNLRRKANKKMLRLPKLKSLTIDINEFATHHFCLLEDLNYLPKLLKSLQALTILYTAPEYEFPTFIEVLKNNHHILTYMTSFSIAKLCAPEHHQAFKGLADSCPNLRHLSFEFSCRYIYNYRGRGRCFSKTRLPIHANCLRVLKTFSNLRSLGLKIADNEAFFSHFVLPRGIRSLSLEFEEDSKLFEENPIFANENFEHLENLETLKLVFNEDFRPDHYGDQNELSQYILRRLPSLKKFIFAVKKSDVERMKWEYELPIEDRSLPQLLESCNKNLETLEIDTYEKILYSEYDFSSLQNKFTNLKTIRFKGSFSEDNPKFIGSFLQQLISLGSSITTIEFTVIIGDEEFFLGLFDELEKVQIPNQLKLKMKIKPNEEPYGYKCYEWPPEEQIHTPKLHNKFRGISLAIFTFCEPWHMTKFLESFADRFDNFKIIYKSMKWNTSSRWMRP